MLIHFKLEYICQEGEFISLLFEEKNLPILQMTSSDLKYWQASIDLPFEYIGRTLSYHYIHSNCTCVLRNEATPFSHALQITNSPLHFFIQDTWCTRITKLYNPFPIFNQPVTDYPHPTRESPSSYNEESVTFRVYCPLSSNSILSVALVGAGNFLGNWHPQDALILIPISPYHWQLTIKQRALNCNDEYKFILLNSHTKELIAWEEGHNRVFTFTTLETRTHFYLPEAIPDFNLRSPRLAGTAIPVFSLRSLGSQGVGDFGDLYSFLNWARATQQHIVQILPINDTTATKGIRDSYPYNAISIFALHPLYIDLRQITPLKDKHTQTKFERQFKALNILPKLDYEASYKIKIDYLHLHFKETYTEISKDRNFKEFCSQNKNWLWKYCVFSYLRDKYNTADFRNWEQESLYNSHTITTLVATSGSEVPIKFYAYLQFLLHIQLTKVAQYARQHKIILKGDIPIGISPHSVEAWSAPELFHLQNQAGAPPDAFAIDGQNWGFPTYNWEVMKQQNYQWWRHRFSKMADYFTAYRIDHILGFFRIWSIPQHSIQGLLGQFDPSLPLSPEEICAMGLPFQPHFMTKPFISDELIYRTFAHHSEFVKQTFLQHEHHDIWQLRPEFSTQVQIAKYFQHHPLQDYTEFLEQGLFSLCNNVLFIEDTKKRNHYHPRILGEQSFIFKRLTTKEQSAYRHIYEDFYYHRHNQFWYQQAMEKLPSLLQSTPMIACGEDLGMVPDCVTWVMQELQILSLEIERMPKTIGKEFSSPTQNSELSVCSIGTHDMETLREWWISDRQRSARYYSQCLGHGAPAPLEPTAELCEEIIQQHLKSPSIFCILTLQDWLSMSETLRHSDPKEERINVPSNPYHNWNYRMHLTIETLLRQTDFNQRITQLCRESQRV